MEHENERIEEQQSEIQEQKDTYVPRPMWQVWGARVALVLFILFVIYQILSIAGGGAL